MQLRPFMGLRLGLLRMSMWTAANPLAGVQIPAAVVARSAANLAKIVPTMLLLQVLLRMQLLECLPLLPLHPAGFQVQW